MKNPLRSGLVTAVIAALFMLPAQVTGAPFDRLPFHRLPLDRLPLQQAPFAYTGIVVLGDSLSDSGNLQVYNPDWYPGDPYFMGRFTNGYNYADDLADGLGLTAEPFLAGTGGLNFAFGGARTSGQAISGVAQLEAWLSMYAPLPPDDRTLFVVFLGANNLRDALASASQDPANALAIIGQEVTLAAGDMAHILGSLAEAGARHIAVLNAPDLGKVPAITGTAGGVLAPLASLATQMYNGALDQVIDTLQTGTGVFLVDVYGLFHDVVSDGPSYGFSNVTDPCLSLDPAAGLTVCDNPDEYLFWDDLHPTAAGHLLLEDTVFEAVLPGPLPPGYARNRR